ncbi:MAG: HNH endonuclease [Chloroflexales bacterium]|nr:HNH endonuclease [Chloroflexales bacterium]
MPRRRRPSRQLWNQIRRQVWERDGGRCRGPYCRNAPPLPLSEVHIDHIVPISAGGSNALRNLRTLCRRCHTLRAGHAHAGMIAAALRDGVIPPDWRALVWDDDDQAAPAGPPSE